MSGKKISGLTLVSEVSGNEKMPISKNGSSALGVSANQLKDFIVKSEDFASKIKESITVEDFDINNI